MRRSKCHGRERFANKYAQLHSVKRYTFEPSQRRCTRASKKEGDDAYLCKSLQTLLLFRKSNRNNIRQRRSSRERWRRPAHLDVSALVHQSGLWAPYMCMEHLIVPMVLRE